VGGRGGRGVMCKVRGMGGEGREGEVRCKQLLFFSDILECVTRSRFEGSRGQTRIDCVLRTSSRGKQRSDTCRKCLDTRDIS
jgi:hypothetical protein